MFVRVQQAVYSKDRKIVPYHRDSPNTGNGVRLRSPSPIMAPGTRLSKAPETFRARKAIAKSRTLRLQPSCFIHIFFI